LDSIEALNPISSKLCYLFDVPSVGLVSHWALTAADRSSIFRDQAPQDIASRARNDSINAT
jgi:hypothetical protein